MNFQILEQFVESKSDDRVCEDMIVVSDDFVAVIDGASDETGARFDGKSGGRLAAELVGATIEALPEDTTARSFADALTAALFAKVGNLNPGQRWPAAAVICASAKRREVWRIGDCNLVVGQTQYPSGKGVDDAAYSFRASVNAALLAQGTPLEEILIDDPGAKASRSLIDIQQHLANRVGPWGFGCINGQAVPSEFVEVVPMPVGPTEVIFTSDGFPVVMPTLGESEAELARLMQQDPAAIGELWPIGKSLKPGANAPDDRAYLRFTID